jgi:hypothetical protein
MLILFMALKIINQNYFFFFKNNYKNINLFLNFINLIKLILMINLFNNQDIYFKNHKIISLKKRIEIIKIFFINKDCSI